MTVKETILTRKFLLRDGQYEKFFIMYRVVIMLDSLFSIPSFLPIRNILQI